MWCPKHDSKTFVRNRNCTNTIITNKNYCELCSENTQDLPWKSSKITFSTKSTTAHHKWANKKNKKVCTKVMSNLKWSNWCFETSSTKKMLDQWRKAIENVETNTESTNQSHWQAFYLLVFLDQVGFFWHIQNARFWQWILLSIRDTKQKKKSNLLRFTAMQLVFLQCVKSQTKKKKWSLTKKIWWNSCCRTNKITF